MSLEQIGFVLAILSILGPLANCIRFCKAHWHYFNTIETVIHHNLSLLRNNQGRVRNLSYQVIQDQQLFHNARSETLIIQINRIENSLKFIHISLLTMELQAQSKFRKFISASKWIEKTKTMQSEIISAENKILFIEGCVTSNASSGAAGLEDVVIQNLYDYHEN